MPAERFFHEKLKSDSQSLELEGSEFHHFFHVMRHTPGDRVELINGKGILAKASVDKIGKKSAQLTLLDIQEAPAPSFSLILAQAIPRSARLDFILEKGTELGMTEIWLFPSITSEKKAFTLHQLERMNGVMISAIKQCGSLHLPTLKIFNSLQQLSISPKCSFFGDTNPFAESFEHAWKKNPPVKQAIFIVGPESGFKEEEIEALKKSGAAGVKLHSNILRTDTAAIAGLSLISHWKLHDSN